MMTFLVATGQLLKININGILAIIGLLTAIPVWIIEKFEKFFLQKTFVYQIQTGQTTIEKIEKKDAGKNIFYSFSVFCCSLLKTLLVIQAIRVGMKLSFNPVYSFTGEPHYLDSFLVFFLAYWIQKTARKNKENRALNVDKTEKKKHSFRLQQLGYLIMFTLLLFLPPCIPFLLSFISLGRSLLQKIDMPVLKCDSPEK